MSEKSRYPILANGGNKDKLVTFVCQMRIKRLYKVNDISQQLINGVWIGKIEDDGRAI